MPLGPFAPHAPALVGGLASTGLAAPPALSQTNTNGSREGGGVVGVSSEVMPTLSAFLFHAAIAFPTPVLYAVLAHADSCADGATGAAANSDGNGEAMLGGANVYLCKSFVSDGGGEAASSMRMVSV
ncbi:hypothetical protein T492DRAFT_1150059 [Pavlovales sp. CCMP2436]|nr:hypothetical protein T492DRAFT_1150059 [Pavlovales sp. CCMP2436]